MNIAGGTGVYHFAPTKTGIRGSFEVRRAELESRLGAAWRGKGKSAAKASDSGENETEETKIEKGRPWRDETGNDPRREV